MVFPNCHRFPFGGGSETGYDGKVVTYAEAAEVVGPSSRYTSLRVNVEVREPNCAEGVCDVLDAFVVIKAVRKYKVHEGAPLAFPDVGTATLGRQFVPKVVELSGRF